MEDNKKDNIEEHELSEEGVEIISYDKEYEEKNIFRRMTDAVRRFRKHKIGGIVWQLVTSLIMLSIAAGIGIFVAVGKVKGGPIPFGEKYFGYFANRNWYNMYNETEIEESKFINRTTFSRCMEEYAIDGNVKDFEVEVQNKTSEYAFIKVTYTAERKKEEVSTEEETPAETPAPIEGETPAEVVVPEETTAPVEEETEPEMEEFEGTHVMKLKRQEENILLFYSTWQGFVDSYIIKNCVIEVPTFITPTFDEFDLTDCYEGVNQETGNAIYKLDRVFTGTHKIKLEGEGIDTKVIDVVWEEHASKYVALQTDFPLKEDEKKSVEEQALNIVVNYYTAALSGNNSDGIKSLILQSDVAHYRVDEQFNNMLSEINHDDGRTLLSMEIAGYNCEIQNYQYRNRLTVVVNYTANYKARGARTVLNGVRKRYEGTNSATATVEFMYTQDGWKVYDAVLNCIDYTVENPQQ